jgi:hypothetical protein
MIASTADEQHMRQKKWKPGHRPQGTGLRTQRPSAEPMTGYRYERWIPPRLVHQKRTLKFAAAIRTVYLTE